MRLSDDITNQRVTSELANFVLNSWQSLGRKAVGIVGKLFSPKRLHGWVLTITPRLVAVRLVREQTVHREECGVWVLNQNQQCIGEDVLHTSTPSIYPNFLEGRHEARHHQVTFIGTNVFHHVK